MHSRLGGTSRRSNGIVNTSSTFTVALLLVVPIGAPTVVEVSTAREILMQQIVVMHKVFLVLVIGRSTGSTRTITVTGSISRICNIARSSRLCSVSTTNSMHAPSSTNGRESVQYQKYE